MTDLRAGAQQALEALENAVRYHGIMLMADPPQDAWKYHRVEDNAKQAITSLRNALVQPEQEPSEWRDMVVVTLVREGINKHRARELADHFAAQPEQEPVACRFCHDRKGCWAWQCYTCGEIDDVQKPTPLPVQEPLTHDEIEVIGDKVANEKLVGPVANFRVRFARAIEAKLKERNSD